MKTHEIPRHQWQVFFDRVSRLHAGEPVHIEVHRLDFGAQLQVSGRPFDGISADLKDGENSITIAVGSAVDDHVAHLITNPLQVRVLRGPGDDDVALEIRAADETATLLYFDAPRCWSPAERGRIRQNQSKESGQ
jgi:Family of unknown function (DUF5335)